MVFLKISQNSQENNLRQSLFFNKLQAESCNFIEKETMAQVFFYEFFEIFKNSFLYRIPKVATSLHTTVLFNDTENAAL